MNRTKKIILIEFISVLALLTLFLAVSIFTTIFDKYRVGSLGADDTVNSLCSNRNSEFSIDINYNNEKKEINSNADLTNLNEKFSGIWKNEVNGYYTELKGYFLSKNNTALYDETCFEQNSWEQYYEKQVGYYGNCLLCVYETGSILPLKLSNYSMRLNRNKAIDLYYFCLNLGIDVQPPGRQRQGDG